MEYRSARRGSAGIQDLGLGTNVTGFCRVLLAGAALLITTPSFSQESSPIEAVRCEREAECLRALKGRAGRQGDVLRLKMADGKWKTMRSNKKACDKDDAAKCVIRELRAYLPAQAIYVVEWTTAGDGGSEVLSATTGQTETLDTMPEFSPSGRWFVSVDPDELNERQYDIAIWSVEAGELKHEFSYMRDAAAYEAWEFKGWDGEDRIKLRLTRPNVPPVDTEAVHTDAGWRLKRP
jgi:hypothetical protein